MNSEKAKDESCQNEERSPFDGAIKNPFAMNDAQRSVHADEAHSQPSSKWLCPGCSRPLTLKRSIHGRPFFAHRSDPCGVGFETALHAFAKQIICESKKVTVPAYRVEGEVTSAPKELTFEHAMMETIDQRSAAVGMVPDCTLISGDDTLYVEIAVTHWVDDRKESKVLDAGASMIEITLSRQIASDLSSGALKEYVLSGAKRVWINNAKHELHVRRLARRRQVAADRATLRVIEIINSYKPSACPAVDIRRYRFLLQKWELSRLVGIASPYPHWFRFCAIDWQTLYLGEMLFDSSDRKRSPEADETYLLRRFNFRYLGAAEDEEVPGRESIFSGLFMDYRQAPGWFNLQLISEVEKGRREYGTGPSGFGNPALALKHFQEHLRRNGSILRLGTDGRYEIEPVLMGKIWRCQRLESLLWKSIPSQNKDFKRRTMNEWLRRVPPGHKELPEVIARSGGAEWIALEQDLVATSKLVQSTRPAPIKNLLGLPLFKANEIANGRSVDHLHRFS